MDCMRWGPGWRLYFRIVTASLRLVILHRKNDRVDFFYETVLLIVGVKPRLKS
jgi:hypothetical protein